MIKAIEPLGKHDRAAFSCGVVALDEWFRFRAGQDEKRNVARVFVAIDDLRGIVGFYSLSSFTLAITDLPPTHSKRLPRYDLIPAALIGRLARDYTAADRGAKKPCGFAGGVFDFADELGLEKIAPARDHRHRVVNL